MATTTKISAGPATLEQRATLELMSAEGRRKELFNGYKAEEKVSMYLSPMYRPYFGSVMTVSINGIAIYFKVDGTTQQVPQSFADEITARRINVDNILKKQGRMSNIPANSESAPGELNLF